MNFQIIKKLDNLFSKQVEKFEDAKLKDGTAVRITGELIEGSKVEIINTDGTLTAPEAGDLLLEDKVITVDANGIITKIADAPAEDAAEPDAEMAENKSESLDVERLNKIEETLSQIINTVNVLVDQLNKEGQEMEKIKVENSELKAKNDELAKTASAQPVAFKKYERTINVQVKQDKPLTLVEKLAEMRENKTKK